MTFCSPKKQAQMAFYYWKKDFFWTKSDSLKADSLKLKTLYVKFFDVKNDIMQPDSAKPAATLNFQQKIPSYLGLVPVVYIENDLFKSENPEALASKVFYRIEEMLHASGHAQVAEYQIDCDWTTTTKEAYFSFLNAFKKKMLPQKKLSATIRLHQIKYADKTGIPPVDKGLLMYYNMSDVKNKATKNSILDNKEALKYLRDGKKYNLPLDFALPVFDWSVLYKHGEFSTIINNINTLNINQLSFLQKQKDNHYICIKDTLWNNTYLRVGDEFRHEFVSEEELLIAAKICTEVANQNSSNIIFFHWEKNNLLHYDNSIFQKAVSCFE